MIRLGHADIEAAIEVAGVGVDDLATMPERESNAERRLAGGSRAGDGDDARLGAEWLQFAAWVRLSLVVARFHGPYYDDGVSVAVGLVGRPGSRRRRSLQRVLRVFTQSLKIVTIAALAIVVAGAGVWAFSYATELARPGDAGSLVMVTVFEDQIGRRDR